MQLHFIILFLIIFCSSISLSIHNPNRYICKLDISQKHLLFKKAQDDENINKWGIWLSSNLSMKRLLCFPNRRERRNFIFGEEKRLSLWNFLQNIEVLETTSFWSFWSKLLLWWCHNLHTNIFWKIFMKESKPNHKLFFPL